MGILNGNSEPVIGLHSIVRQSLHQDVGEGEIIGGGIVLVSVEVPENVGNVDIDIHSVRPSHVVQPGIGDSRLFQVMEHGGVVVGVDRGLTHPVDGLYLSCNPIEIDPVL